MVQSSHGCGPSWGRGVKMIYFALGDCVDIARTVWKLLCSVMRKWSWRQPLTCHQKHPLISFLVTSRENICSSHDVKFFVRFVHSSHIPVTCTLIQLCNYVIDTFPAVSGPLFCCNSLSCRSLMSVQVKTSVACCSSSILMFHTWTLAGRVLCKLFLVTNCPQVVWYSGMPTA